MRRLFVIPIILGIAAAASLLAVVASEPESSETHAGFTYGDIETVQGMLAERGITMSPPAAVTDDTISHYCTFFEDGAARTVRYCTTTSVTGPGGVLSGNINMGGDASSPVLAIANLETPTVQSGREEVVAVVEAMIKTLVCDCWEEVKAEGDIESVSAWVDQTHKFYGDSGGRSIASRVDDLTDASITLEITPKGSSVLQTLVILK